MPRCAESVRLPKNQRGRPLSMCSECETTASSAAPTLPQAAAAAGCSSEDEDAEEYFSQTDDASGDEGMDHDVGGQPTRIAPPKLWSKAQFPEGVRPLAANWDMANLAAAQEWECPCLDRRNCLAADRGLTLIHLYEHRKNFLLTTCNNNGGRRDATRAQLSAHYSNSTKSFSRSFVVGPLNDCCAAAAGLASGVSVQTFCNARADLRAKKPLRSKRTARRTE